MASGGTTGEASGSRCDGGRYGEEQARWPALRHSEGSQRSVAIATGGHTAALLAPRPRRMLAVAHANGCQKRVAVDSRARPDACRARCGQRSRRGRKRHQESTQGTSADGSSQGRDGLQHDLPHRLVMVRPTNTGPALVFQRKMGLRTLRHVTPCFENHHPFPPCTTRNFINPGGKSGGLPGRSRSTKCALHFGTY
jgi:hypothetical protein